MSVNQIYEEAIKPLSREDKIAIARLIVNAFESEPPQEEFGFDYLKRILPQIERITLTDHDLAGVILNGPQSK